MRSQSLSVSPWEQAQSPTCDMFIYIYIVIQYTSTYIYVLLNIILYYIHIYMEIHTLHLWPSSQPQITCWLMFFWLRLVFVQELLVLL